MRKIIILGILLLMFICSQANACEVNKRFVKNVNKKLNKYSKVLHDLQKENTKLKIKLAKMQKTKKPSKR